MTSPSKWFVFPQANPQATRRLFFFPYAGGGPAVFGKWCFHLPSHTEGGTVHYPGRGSRANESPVVNMNKMVTGLLESIQPLTEKPFALFGHSLGGLLAFELTRALRKKGLPQPFTLFVSGCAAPHLQNERSALHSLPDAELIEELKTLNGIPTELLQTPDLLKMFLPALRADFEVLETYSYIEAEPLDCRIIALGGSADPRVSQAQVEGWATHTTSAFQSHYFPGGHFFLEPNKDEVIEVVIKAIS